MSVADGEVLLTFVNSGYMPDGYVPKLRDVYSVKEYIRELGEYRRRLQRVLATDSSELAEERRNRFSLACSVGKQGDRLCVAEVLLLF